ncbi:iron-sulfur cluster-binding protein, rieske family domain protein [Fusarium austroafricanum]|uniref:Choline monooxygenase, chloroplastic n=1 Tax=Fusarium austroafricanum TaxID=2364996 RepID=A0A8H4K9E6_9HYPO|nr:iron-sulfur cluster-binding protein, rieske family domain protein [Fusarium austroafricanum]
MFRLFNSAPSSKPDTDVGEKKHALPASWYHSAPLYSLERRAIFSRKWLLVTHRLRFQSAGDYVSFEEAGFSFFLVKDRDGNINGFHNICRHRAYPIVTDGSGSASILSCKYHGWSYGFKGNLAKAPRFDSVPDFDKSQHSLFSIHTHVDNKGFVWVNFDASETPEIAWDTDFEGVDTQDRLKAFDLDNDYHFDHHWNMVGDYNWKTLADNYNECYHCATSHPDVAANVDLDNYCVKPQKNYIIHYGPNKDPTKEVVKVASTFLFPNASFTVTAHFFFMQRCIPISATRTKMEYDVYRKNDASDEDFSTIDSFFKRVMKEDKDLCNGAQRNLNGGIFVNGQLHPEKEQGPIWFQGVVRELLMSYREKEEKENGGDPIWPATRKTVNSNAKREEEEKFCAGLEMGHCPGVGDGVLSW